jgi:hypothetical protein
MFQGRSFRVRRESNNRYEFRSQYTLQYGTAAEIAKLITDQMGEAQRNAIELAVAKQKLRQIATTEDGATILDLVKTAPVSQPIPSAAPVRAPEPGPRAVARYAAASKHRATRHRVQVVEYVTPSIEPPKPKRRPNSLSYLKALREQEALENAQ